MPDDAIAAAYERAVEQTMSDERLLGVLPDDLSRVMLEWTIAQLDRVAAAATSLDDFERGADDIRRQARAIADASADAGDDPAALTARLDAAARGLEREEVSQNAVPVDTGSGGTEHAAATSPSAPATGTRTQATASPSLTSSLRMSLQRAYHRFRSFLGGGAR